MHQLVLEAIIIIFIIIFVVVVVVWWLSRRLFYCHFCLIGWRYALTRSNQLISCQSTRLLSTWCIVGCLGHYPLVVTHTDVMTTL